MLLVEHPVDQFSFQYLGQLFIKMAVFEIVTCGTLDKLSHVALAFINYIVADEYFRSAFADLIQVRLHLLHLVSC